MLGHPVDAFCMGTCPYSTNTRDFQYVDSLVDYVHVVEQSDLGYSLIY